MIGIGFLAAMLFQAPRPSLLVNGSFEEGPLPGRFANQAGGSSAIKGWVVTGEGIDYIGTLWPGSNGPRSIDLDGSVRSSTTPPFVHGGIAQTFATTPGTRYLVTFDLAGNPLNPPLLKPMRVSAAGQSVEFSFDVTGKSPARMGWVSKQWTFTANAASTTLELQSLTASPLTGWGAAIDNVSVTAEKDTQLEVTETEKEIEVRVGAEVLFATGKYELRPAAAAAAALERLAALLQAHPGLPILIEGHTDSVGTAAANQVLGERRAKAVMQWLTSKGGIPAAGMSTVGYGLSHPAASNRTAAGRQKNRRVEIRIRKN